MKTLFILLSIIFIAAGFTKITGLKFQKRHFKHWNLPVWFMYLTGVLEVAAGICLLFPVSQYFGAALGSFVLMGAVATSWIVYENRRSLLPLTLLVLCGAVMWDIQPAPILTYAIFGILGISLLASAILWLYPSTPMNKDGETELLSKTVTVTHHFTEALGVGYHYVTAGKPDRPSVVIVPGAPESWYCFHHQIIALSKKYFVVALDMKPYGQTGKDQDGDHSYAHIAEEVKVLLDKISIQKFYLMGHDRGAVVTDHLLSKEGMTDRVQAYVRMQQSFNEPHGKPVPPHHLMKSFWGTMAFKIRFGMWLVYVKSAYTKLPIAKNVIQRITREFQFKGMATSVPLSFKTTSFDKERKDRFDFLFKGMTMPVLILQGRFDPGQHPEEYEQSHEFAPDLQVEFIEAGHFFHLEAPRETNEAIMGFFEEN